VLNFLIGQTLYVNVAVTLDIFVYIHLRCIANKLKKMSKILTLSPSGKMFADAHGLAPSAFGCPAQLFPMTTQC